MAEVHALILTLVAATGGAALGNRLRIPAGTMVGAMVLAAPVNVVVGGFHVPAIVRTAIMIGVGLMVGLLVQRDAMRSLRRVALPALLTATGLILSGIAIAQMTTALGVAPDGVVYATAPGALSVLAIAAVEHGGDAPAVVLFHVVRLVLVLLSLPFLVRLLSPQPTTAAEPTTSPPAAPTPPEPPAIAPQRQTTPRVRQAAMLALAATCAATGALVLQLLNIPGALVLGASAGGASVALLSTQPLTLPPTARHALSAGVGWVLATLVTPETVASLGSLIAPAILSAGLLIIAGVAMTLVLRTAGSPMAGDLLATSPGAVEGASIAAAEHDAGSANVVVFHTTRVILVIMCLPVLVMVAE